MDHIVTMKDTETYAERRAAMAGESRRRILEATIATLARGVEELSMPAVAKEAGVSVPTVYRNFPDKKALMAATIEYLHKLRSPAGDTVSLDDLEGTLRAEYEKSANLPEHLQMALASAPIMKARSEVGMRARRRKGILDLLGPALDDVSPDEREDLVSMVVVLCSSQTMRSFATLVGATPAEAARTVAWTIRRLVESSGAKKGKKR
jgi:AcrR family transcriptional regulator